MRYWIGLGSNLGQRAVFLAEAILRLVRAGVKPVRLSSVYETAPVGITHQPVFLNMVIAADSSAAPREMLQKCLEIEAKMGRVRREKWGPRSIDIDLLMADGLTLVEDDLVLPHPRMIERQFVLVPLAEIAPALILADGRPAAQAADNHGPGVARLGSLAECVRKEIANNRVRLA